MLYVSTRGEARKLSFSDALLAGLARDGGLYVPEATPRLTPAEIEALAGASYAEAAARVISPYVDDAISERELMGMTSQAYSGFRHPAVAPLVQIDDNLFVLELFHGPTLAFKDFAMQWLGRAMNRALQARGARATIVGATSGDTGAAAVEAFAGQSQTEIFILYPHGRVSEAQRRQMTTVDKPNVHTLAIEGTFDDCQAIVKGLFNNLSFRDAHGLTGINSINWGRIVGQIVYYFTSAVTLGAPHRRVSF
ncbi:MAG TPA: threonine synthase, partial [Roseiarcus sp.]|nr:threonine synthase [Roseiarcus sp.]